MAVRKKLTKSTRFEVLKRDKFTCQYCGAKAPDVLLDVDHVHPVSKGGTDDMLNLTTSCKACNSGKSDRVLSDDSVVTKQRSQLDELQERREQLDLLMQWKTGLLASKDDEVKRVAEYWERLLPGWEVNAVGLAAIKKLVRKHGAVEAMEAMDGAMHYIVEYEKGLDPESVEKAFSSVPRIAAMKREHEENPYLKDLFYVRAIIRNRFSYVRERDALAYLKEAHAAGATIPELKDIARSTSNWSEWSRAMMQLAEELDEEAAQ